MKLFLIVAFTIVIVAMVVIMFFKSKRGKATSDVADENTGLAIEGKLARQGFCEMTVHFDDLPALTEDEETRLVEVTDSKLIAKIDDAVPGTLQAIANTGAVKEYAEVAKSMGQLYQAIIPKGAVLDKSRDMEGAVRATYREGANSIKGQANLMAVDNNAANNLARLNIANAVMGAAAMVVG